MNKKELKEKIIAKRLIENHKMRIASKVDCTKKSQEYAKKLAERLESHIEETLEDAENCVKEFFPARYVSASLTRLQNRLVSSGICCKFDKSVSKKAILETASSDITPKECEEAVDKIAQAVLDETNEALDSCDKAIEKISDKNFADCKEKSNKIMRESIESKLRNEGVNFKF